MRATFLSRDRTRVRFFAVPTVRTSGLPGATGGVLVLRRTPAHTGEDNSRVVPPQPPPARGEVGSDAPRPPQVAAQPTFVVCVWGAVWGGHDYLPEGNALASTWIPAPEPTTWHTGWRKISWPHNAHGTSIEQGEVQGLRLTTRGQDGHIGDVIPLHHVPHNIIFRRSNLAPEYQQANSLLTRASQQRRLGGHKIMALCPCWEHHTSNV